MADGGVHVPLDAGQLVAKLGGHPFQEPGVQGDRAQGGTKPAELETGVNVQVPLFLNEGDVIKVDTRSGEYLERVSS